MINEKIRAHVSKFNKSKGYGTADKDIIETLKERDFIWQGEFDSRRHWEERFTVVKIDGMLIGFVLATTQGDESAEDKGWEFDPNSICEVESKEIITTIYTRKGE